MTILVTAGLWYLFTCALCLSVLFTIVALDVRHYGDPHAPANEDPIERATETPSGVMEVWPVADDRTLDEQDVSQVRARSMHHR